MSNRVDTSTPLAARDHARSMAGTIAATMPTIPPSTAIDVPAGVAPEQMLWAETLGAGGYASRVLRRGSRLRLTDVEGDACVALLVYNAVQPTERLNVADTVKVQWNAYLTQRSLLLSDMGRVLMSILSDESARHDTFGGCSNQKTNLARYGDGANHSTFPNTRDRFLLALAKHGLGRKDVMPNLNVFKGVRIEEDGGMTFVGESSVAGQSVELRAEMDVLVVLVNSPHVLDDRPGYNVSPVRVRAWTDAVTGPNDAVRNSTPESLRAFQNTEDYLLGSGDPR